MEVIMTGDRLTNNCKLYHDEKDLTKFWFRFGLSGEIVASSFGQMNIAEKAAGEIRVGDRVSVSGLDVKQFLMRHPSKKSKNYEPIGTVRFVGSVDFVDDDSKLVKEKF